MAADTLVSAFANPQVSRAFQRFIDQVCEATVPDNSTGTMAHPCGRKVVSGTEFCNEHQVIDELTYRSYSYQRRRFPEVCWTRWAALFGYAESEAMEDRFTAEYGGQE